MNKQIEIIISIVMLLSTAVLMAAIEENHLNNKSIRSEDLSLWLVAGAIIFSTSMILMTNILSLLRRILSNNKILVKLISSIKSKNKKEDNEKENSIIITIIIVFIGIILLNISNDIVITKFLGVDTNKENIFRFITLGIAIATLIEANCTPFKSKNKSKKSSKTNKNNKK